MRRSRSRSKSRAPEDHSRIEAFEPLPPLNSQKRVQEARGNLKINRQPQTPTQRQIPSLSSMGSALNPPLDGNRWAARAPTDPRLNPNRPTDPRARPTNGTPSHCPQNWPPMIENRPKFHNFAPAYSPNRPQNWPPTSENRPKLWCRELPKIHNYAQAHPPNSVSAEEEDSVLPNHCLPEYDANDNTTTANTATDNNGRTFSHSFAAATSQNASAVRSGAIAPGRTLSSSFAAATSQNAAPVRSAVLTPRTHFNQQRQQQQQRRAIHSDDDDEEEENDDTAGDHLTPYGPPATKRGRPELSSHHLAGPSTLVAAASADDELTTSNIANNSTNWVEEQQALAINLREHFDECTKKGTRMRQFMSDFSSMFDPITKLLQHSNQRGQH